VDVYDYILPPGRIAQEPAEPRTAARLLDAVGPEVVHRRAEDLPALLGPGDLLVLNETKVLPARLHLRKRTGGAVEVLLLESTQDGGLAWEALVRPGRRVVPGTRLLAGDREVVEVGRHLEGGRREVVLLQGGVAEEFGAVPLPPYIHRPLEDPERYQTVYAARPGSVAAPTAGLHLDEDLLEQCTAAGAAIVKVDLAVGLDTFRPVEGALEDHVMHSERFSVPSSTLDACARAGRVIAVGTTTARALESAALGTREGRTDLFIKPGFDFKIVDVLLTNFHMPRSTQLVMLAAFCGPRWRGLYDIALDEGYRFLSFGDCMLVSKASA
jgi:S-adenosylmethionine:tRNA ribosyltransferase-isomerase